LEGNSGHYNEREGCMLLEVSEHGTVKMSSWNDMWWGKVKEAEARLGQAVCGSDDGSFHVCEAIPSSRIGRCRKHYVVTETSSDIFRDPVYAKGAQGLRVCGVECGRAGTCEYYSKYFERRPAEVKPYCYVDAGTYLNQVKGLLSEVIENKIEVTQFVKAEIQAIAMGMVQVGQCDEQIAENGIVVEEVSTWKMKGSERVTTTPKENPAVGARVKLLKSIAESNKSIMLPPKTKKELGRKGEHDGARSPMELAGELVEKAGKLVAKNDS